MGEIEQVRSAAVRVQSIEEAQELAGDPELARLERLTITFRCGRYDEHVPTELFVGNVVPEDDVACVEFFATADLTSLRELTIEGSALGRGSHGLGPQGIDAVVASGLIPQLSALSLTKLPLGDAPLVKLIAALDREGIESLTLRGLALSDVTAEGFTGTYFALRELNLSRNFLTESGAQHLAHDVDLPALERLDLSGDPGGSPYDGSLEIQPIGDAGAVAWASSHNAVNLTELRLAATGLTPEAVPELLLTGQLEILDLTYNQLTNDDLVTLTTALADLDGLNLVHREAEARTFARKLRG